MIRRFRRLYGANPLHLLALIASLAIAAAAAVRWFDAGSDTPKILLWFAGAIVAHDVVLWPLYTLLDRVAHHGADRLATRAQRPATGWVYIRVPALISAILFLVFSPEILSLGDSTYHRASGLHQDVYLARYLITVGALFALSALTYALHLRRGDGRRPTTDAAPPPARTS